MNTAAQIAEAFGEIRDRIAAAGGTAVSLLPVTKGFGPEAIQAALANGADAVGENYVQELVSKLDELAPTSVAVHMIGQLQTNKVRHLAGRVALYETVDRTSLVDQLARRDPGAHVLIQVNTTEDLHKGGCRLDDVERLVTAASDAGLVVEGLMTVGPTDAPPAAAAPGFRAVRAAVDSLGLEVCSMGMSDDLEVAIGEGSTQVRIGSALFGERPNRH